jgi:hypothetical protein
MSQGADFTRRGPAPPEDSTVLLIPAGYAGLAEEARWQEHGSVPAWNSFSFAFGPIVAGVLVGVFALILRWAFRRGSSVVAAPPRPGAADDYGLLVPVAFPSTYVEGELLRRRLEDGGVRANLASTLDGPRVLVWPQDEAQARQVLAGGR